MCVSSMNGRSHPGDRLNMLEGNIHPGLSFLSLLLRLLPFSRPSTASLLIPLRFSASPWANHPSNLCMSHQLCVWPVHEYRALFDLLSPVESRGASTWSGKIPKPIQINSSKPPIRLDSSNLHSTSSPRAAELSSASKMLSKITLGLRGLQVQQSKFHTPDRDFDTSR